MPEMSNDMLTLWLRAGSGLQASEARDLVERLAQLEHEYEADTDAMRAEHARELEEAYESAAEGGEAYDTGWAKGFAKGETQGRKVLLGEVLRILRGPGWGPKPTRQAIVDGIYALAKEPATAD